IREHHRWALFHEPRLFQDEPPEWLKTWEGDGIIARVHSPKVAELLLRRGIPVVDALGIIPETGIPLVHVDDREIARLAVEHLLDRGFRNFGFFGITGVNWSERRRDACGDFLSKAGFQLSVFEETHFSQMDRHWEKRADVLVRWIVKLPKPAGVMVCSDQKGIHLLEACRRAGVAVPDEVAVVGVDNDEPLCEIAIPSLSSVWPAHAQVGYRAAGLLDRLMAGERAPAQPIFVSSGSVKTRQSSDTLAIRDQNLAKAVSVIRENACLGISVDDVAARAGLSRSVLQRRFRQQFGKTIHDEIMNVRIRRACHLLGETDFPLLDIAEQCGFSHQEYMGAVFRARLKKTPAEFRRTARQMDSSNGA
ncbi:MAG: DNA-binding transcriptional regulator, partial [Verrucomicrobia bacterium]